MRKVTRAILQRVCMGGLAAPSRGMAALRGNVVLSSKKSGLQLGVGPPGPSWPGLAHLVGSEPGQR